MMTEIFVVDNYNIGSGNESFDVDLFFENDYIKELVKEKHNVEFNDKNEIESISVQLKAEWEFTMEMRSWGVKTLSVCLTEVKDVYCHVEIYDEDKDTELEFELELDLSEFEVETETQDKFDGQYKLSNIQINFQDKTIYGSFE